MEHIDKGVFHEIGCPDQVFFDFLVFRVVQHQMLGRHVNVGCQIHFLIYVPHSCEVFVVVNGELLGGQELGQLVLKIFEVRLDLLHKEGVLGQATNELLLLGEVEHRVVYLQGFLHTFVDLLGG